MNHYEDPYSTTRIQCHRIHVTEYFSYIYHKNQPKVGKYTNITWILWESIPYPVRFFFLNFSVAPRRVISLQKKKTSPKLGIGWCPNEPPGSGSLVPSRRFICSEPRCGSNRGFWEGIFHHCKMGGGVVETCCLKTCTVVSLWTFKVYVLYTIHIYDILILYDYRNYVYNILHTFFLNFRGLFSKIPFWNIFFGFWWWSPLRDVTCTTGDLHRWSRLSLL